MNTNVDFVLQSMAEDNTRIRSYVEKEKNRINFSQEAYYLLLILADAVIAVGTVWTIV